MMYQDASHTGPYFVVTVDGNATDIRSTSALAIRQGKVQKSRNPQSAVEIHYAEANAATRKRDGQLVVDVTAFTSSATLLATVKE